MGGDKKGKWGRRRERRMEWDRKGRGRDGKIVGIGLPCGAGEAALG